MSKKVVKELTFQEKLENIFYKEHYMSMYTTSECEFGDHVDVTCSCGYKNETYGSTRDVVSHVLEVISSAAQPD